MKMRLQKILSSRGVASRRHAEILIGEGRVFCNGKVCAVGDSADPDRDLITVDGKPIPPEQKYVYIMLNKPKGYVTTLSDERGRADAAQLVAQCGVRVYPVGRLDMDSEGLLIFTNDGEFANRLMHPRHEVKKIYLVYVRDFTQEKLRDLHRPIVLDGYRIKPPEISCVNAEPDGKASLKIMIHEGRNRQVRRMCAAAGMKVTRLVRVGEGKLVLGALESGKWRYLTESEIKDLEN